MIYLKKVQIIYLKKVSIIIYNNLFSNKINDG